jgi:hypothetical protein
MELETPSCPQWQKQQCVMLSAPFRVFGQEAITTSSDTSGSLEELRQGINRDGIEKKGGLIISLATSPGCYNAALRYP